MAFPFSATDEAEILNLSVPCTPPSPHELTALEMFFMDGAKSSDVCPRCKKDADSDTVQCDGCQAWLHMAGCAGTPPPEGFATIERFICPICVDKLKRRPDAIRKAKRIKN